MSNPYKVHSKIKECEKCDEPIVWLFNSAKQKKWPINADSCSPDALVYDRLQGHVPHFTTCTKSDRPAQSPATCRDCDLDVIWMRTFKGKAIMVDPAGVEPSDTQYDKNKHKCHFETCAAKTEGAY